MTVRVVEERGRLVVDIRTRLPTGKIRRERRNAPDGIKSKSAAKRWGESRQAHLVHNGPDITEEPAPTLADFAPRWMKEYARANGNKPSTLAAKETILKLHLVPVLGRLRLDQIAEIDVQRLKLHLEGMAEKTRACVLSQLATMLRTAERWEEIIKAPHIALPRIPVAPMEFYDFPEWERLVDGARRAGPMVLAAILLGGEAGLRRGELIALEQADIGPTAINIQHNEWEGIAGTTKGGKFRRVPMTDRLREAVAVVRHIRGKRLLWQANGHRVGITTLQSWLETACRRAGLPPSRNLHRLRHTFCSHLAMRGAPAKTIQELAGHADLKTTMRYMHLARGSAEAAIALLGRGAGGEQVTEKARI
jgi:integrase